MRDPSVSNPFVKIISEMKFEIKFLILFNAYCLIFSLTAFILLRLISLNKQIPEIYKPVFERGSLENQSESIFDVIAQQNIENYEKLTWKNYSDMEFVVNGLINNSNSDKFKI